MEKLWICFCRVYIYEKISFDEFSRPHISIQGEEILNEVINSGEPVIFISGHFANFELMAMELEKKINLCAIYRPLNNFLINPFMVSIRKNIFVEIKLKRISRH